MTEILQAWKQSRCRPCQGGVVRLEEREAREKLSHLPGWEFNANSIFREFAFENYYQTLSFVNAVAWIAHRQDHHPDITFGYRNCRVTYRTHAIDGLSENDFICAAHVEALTQP